MEPTKEIYLRSLIRKLKCVQEDFSDVDRLSNEFDTDFQKAWRIALSHMRSKQNPGVFQQLLDEIASAERKSEESSESDKHTHNERTLFRKITLETHPDRAHILGIDEEEEVDKRKSLFVRAHEAYKANDMETLVSIALEIDLSLEDLGLEYDDVVEKIENLTQKVYTKMESITTSLAWVWGTSVGDVPKRSQLIKMMLHRHGYSVEDDTLISDIVSQHEESISTGASSSKVRRKPGQRPRRTIR